MIQENDFQWSRPGKLNLLRARKCSPTRTIAPAKFFDGRLGRFQRDLDRLIDLGTDIGPVSLKQGAGLLFKLLIGRHLGGDLTTGLLEQGLGVVLGRLENRQALPSIGIVLRLGGGPARFEASRDRPPGFLMLLFGGGSLGGILLDQTRAGLAILGLLGLGLGLVSGLDRPAGLAKLGLGGLGGRGVAARRPRLLLRAFLDQTEHLAEDRALASEGMGERHGDPTRRVAGPRRG